MDTKNIAKDWSKIAGEPVNVENSKGTYYGFTSELGTLRLLKAYQHSIAQDTVRAEYSKNLRAFYFALDA